MTSRALIIPTIELQPNPLPFGQLSLRKGNWDRLQARKAYDETAHDRPDDHPALDRRI